jgi:hypothetical protein
MTSRGGTRVTLRVVSRRTTPLGSPVRSSNSWRANDNVPVTLAGVRLEMDQRTMAFGERRDTSVIVVDGLWSRAGGTCYMLYLDVLRYQAYQLSTNRETGILYRGSLIRDLGRPYVGVFLRTNGDLLIQTYDRDAAGNVVNPWAAAALHTVSGLSSTGTTQAMVMGEAGLIFIDGANNITFIRTLRSGCL